MILGTVPLDAGHAMDRSGVVFGELGQARRRFRPASALVTGFLGASRAADREARSLLAKFGLGAGDVERALGTLSPGERTRAELALLMAVGANCLVLDEPTNHLDLPAIEQLEAGPRGLGGHACCSSPTTGAFSRPSRSPHSRAPDAPVPSPRARDADADPRIYAPRVTDAEAMAIALAEAASPSTTTTCRSGRSSSSRATSSPGVTTNVSCARTRRLTPRSSPCATLRRCSAPGTSTAPRSW